jgi:hypothetical protein
MRSRLTTSVFWASRSPTFPSMCCCGRRSSKAQRPRDPRLRSSREWDPTCPTLGCQRGTSHPGPYTPSGLSVLVASRMQAVRFLERILGQRSLEIASRQSPTVNAKKGPPPLRVTVPMFAESRKSSPRRRPTQLFTSLSFLLSLAGSHRGTQ